MEHTQMNGRVITDAQQVSAEWLTAALARSGTLRAGRVRDVDADADKSVWSQIVRLRPRYDDAAAGELPTALLLKICAGDDAVFGSSEVDYYVRDYVDLPDAPIPRCYDAQFSEEPRAYHILMEDLSATHTNTWERPPTLEHGRAVAEALATLHAHWWGAERLRASGGMPGQPEIDRYIGHVRQGLDPLIDMLGDALDPAWRLALRDIFAHHPAKLVERTRDNAGFTLVHGDVNPGNILAPRETPGPVYLVDRQPFDWSLTTWLGASDLAYMIVHRWDAELRRQWELPILRHYHEQLIGRGVTDFSWEQLVYDYRLTAVQSVYVAVEWCVLEQDRTRMRWLWEQQLQKAMTAFFDLRCAELW
jgi:thiamine kinase-like enzyme